MLNSPAMHCTLLVPHLFWPRESADDAYRGLALEPLQTFLARAEATRYPPVCVEGWLCEAYQVARQHDWPVAPLTLALDGGDAAEGYWLRADPVHLRLGRERVLLMESRLLDIRREEADALIAALNDHFASHGLAFHAPHSDRWYARVEEPPLLTTHTLSEAAGQDVNAWLPSGEDALAWHRLLNEIQMLLHAHAANAARETAGTPPVNSVWFWGGGTQPRVPAKPYGAVWSNDALAVALAARADTHAAPLPSDAASWLAEAQQLGTGIGHLVVTDFLAITAAYGDVAGWREQADSFNARWFAPLVTALKRRQVSRLAVVVPSSWACWRFEATSNVLLKIWRPSKPLHRYA